MANSNNFGNASSSKPYFARDRDEDNPLFTKDTGKSPFSKPRRDDNRGSNPRPRNNQHFERQPRSLGYSFLDSLINQDTEKMLLVLIKEREGFNSLLNKDISLDMTILIVKILSKICSSKFSDTKYSILHFSFNEKFVEKLSNHIACIPRLSSTNQRGCSSFWKDPDEFWTGILTICDDLLHTTPTFACKTLPPVLTAMKIYFPVVEQIHNLQISEEIKKKVEKMQDVIKMFEADNKKNDKKDTKQQNGDSTEPPDDFRKISVYPSAEEIVGGRGFLRENVIEGPYQNVDHYLDVQFRLLREDFVGPLRDGIGNFRSTGSTSHLENVRVHKNVKFLNAETINEFYCVRVEFASKKKIHNIENSKRFMFGSLLCFTKDNFETIFFGKVAQRQMKDLKEGQIIVAFDEKLQLDFNIKTYLMVECSVYFEPYFHVLTVLKSMTAENFPMERYFIRVKASIQPPEYLAVPDCTYTIEEQTFNPVSQWPKATFYDLNESQMVAFKAAITEEISVIQGPPGTGKTYLGLKVAETLLRNRENWYDKTPILVICYTNHALDQFLEGLIPTTNRIIRVGGQSKNTALDVYNLRNRTERDDYTVVEKKRQVQDCLRKIKQITENLQQIEHYNSVLSFSHFREVVPFFDESWFATAKNEDVARWLLEEVNYDEGKSKRRNNLENLQAQEEIIRIGLNDDNSFEEDTESIEESDFNDHINFKFDSIFEIYHLLRGTNLTLVKLEEMRDQMKFYENKLGELREVQNPSFHELIREEELYITVENLRHKYEYLKTQLVRGQSLENTFTEAPKSVNLSNPNSMSYKDRWNLYFYWLNLYRTYHNAALQNASEEFPTLYKKYEELREIEDVRAMKNALVVGMTTTSAARLRSSLQTLKNPIVIVEEAAEVLEAHIVTSITKHCKHLILIGDHKQLRPSTASYNLDKQYRLGISLFERMIRNNIHCYTLNVQHRMRPEIASLIRPSIYNFLEDHPTVLQRPLITGVDKCLFFVHHDNLEECDGTSKVNHHEVTFLIYLARHLVLNGYNPENITILSAYLGQFFAFQNERKNHLDLLDGMRIAVLDNYQGEECDIILLSLVRNNEDNKIGFLAIENRVCVALSRARNGLYVMGNMDQLCYDNKLWRKIKDTLEDQNALGEELPLRCQIHQDQVTLVKTHEDFYAVAEGGCGKKCDADLQCGHKCSYLCHIRDRNHMMYKCQTLCNKQLCEKDRTHTCQKRCFEDCGPCEYMVQRTLPCNHQVHIPCHVDPGSYKCQVLIGTKLPCGHTTDKPCFCDPETFRCPHMCEVQVQPCGHSCGMLCHVRKDPDHLEYTCRKPCSKYMKGCTVEEEDHRCKKLCFQECDNCTITVRKQRTNCRHFYDVPCNQDVDTLVCVKPCAKKLECGHPCRGRCNEPCQRCQQMTSKKAPICGHEIKVKCCDPPDRKLCYKKCPLLLPCNHPCTNKCNETCTTKCTVLVDNSGIPAACGHIVTRVECHMTKVGVDPLSLIKYCRQPCTAVLKCGHKCSGSCGACAQGRVHKRCDERCGVPLVCDHPCNFPCRQACRPCKKVCNYRCQHSVCMKECGEVCTPCVERCPRRCLHQWCTKLCGEICNVSPCQEACNNFLKCGHPCIGFCGDPCPPKCLICNREELLEIFFGSESENSRFVLLNDCKHIFESSGMEEWLQQDEYQISYKLCPRCKTPIKTTQRYSNYVKRAINDVAQVKMKANGSLEEIEQIRKQMESLLRTITSKCGKFFTFIPRLGDFLMKIKNRIQPSKKGRRPNINIYDARSLKSKLEILQQIVDLCCDERVVFHTPREIFIPQINFVVDVLARDIDYITNQEIDDLNPEIDRLSRIIEFSCLRNSSQYNYHSVNNEEAKTIILSIQKELFGCKKFTSEVNEVMKIQLKELNKLMNTAIAITDREKKEIVQAMGFSKGHWYKCPNGHVYVIGECGRPMEESRCNECGAAIGGRGHRFTNASTQSHEMFTV